jgi:Sec-independent protein translocase protein TatA
MELLGVGAPEALVILVITLLIVGPQRFPEIARQGGRYYRMARRYAAEVTEDVRGAMSELEAEVEQQQQQIKEAHDEISRSVTTSMDQTREELEAAGRSTQELLTDKPAPEPYPPRPSNGSGALLAPRELSTDEGEDTVRGESD